MPSAATQQTPLTTLLSHALVAFTIEFDNLAEERITVRHGRSAIDALRAALVPAAAADTPLPHHLPIVGGAMFSEVVSRPEPLPDEPDGLDLSALLARAFGLAVVAPAPGAARGKVVRLNARGMSARERGIARIARIEAELRARLGRQAGDRLRRALEAVLASPAFAEGIEPPATGWRARPPYAAQTGRLLTDPRAALPRHPLMLHRGGYPDGA